MKKSLIFWLSLAPFAIAFIFAQFIDISRIMPVIFSIVFYAWLFIECDAEKGIEGSLAIIAVSISNCVLVFNFGELLLIINIAMFCIGSILLLIHAINNDEKNDISGIKRN